MDEVLVSYWGRWWDAPMTNEATKLTPEQAQKFVNGQLSRKPICDLCQEAILLTDDALLLPYMTTHLECNLRSGLGDVQHLEKRCMCFRGSGNEITYDSDHFETYRESAKAALAWLLEHRQGSFRD